MVIFFTTYSQFFLRIYLQRHATTASLSNMNYWFDVMTDLGVLSCALSFALGFACWSVIVASSENVAKIYPITTSLTLFFVTILNIMMFSDRFSMINLFGGGFIILGIFFLLHQKTPHPSPAVPTLQILEN